jgi:hypothetical protein
VFVGALVLGLQAAATAWVRSSSLFASAEQALGTDTGLRRELGEPVSVGWLLFVRHAQTEGLDLDAGTARATLYARASGPRRSAWLELRLARGGGRCSMQVRTLGVRGRTIRSGSLPCR